jgi:membrane-associated phospholipid phosphatase
VIVAFLILVFHGTAVPPWPWLLAAHGAGIALVHWLVRSHARLPMNRVLDFLRHFYPVLLYAFLYRETGELHPMFISGYLDPIFLRLEASVFGMQPSLTFMQNLPYWPVSEIFYASYFSYYVMIVGVGLALFRRNRPQFFHCVSVVSFVFYVCYLIYVFTPVMGPRILHRAISGYALPAEARPETVPGFPAAIQAGLFFRIMDWIYDHFEAPGAAFPSSHVAVAITTVYFSFRYLRRIRFLHLGIAVLLCLSTVYCRYHYVVDVVGGMATAAVLVPLGNWLYFRSRRMPEAGPQPRERPTEPLDPQRR